MPYEKAINFCWQALAHKHAPHIQFRKNLASSSRYIQEKAFENPSRIEPFSKTAAADSQTARPFSSLYWETIAHNRLAFHTLREKYITRVNEIRKWNLANIPLFVLQWRKRATAFLLKTGQIVQAFSPAPVPFRPHATACITAFINPCSSHFKSGGSWNIFSEILCTVWWKLRETATLKYCVFRHVSCSFAKESKSKICSVQSSFWRNKQEGALTIASHNRERKLLLDQKATIHQSQPGIAWVRDAPLCQTLKNLLIILFAVHTYINYSCRGREAWHFCKGTSNIYEMAGRQISWVGYIH